MFMHFPPGDVAPTGIGLSVAARAALECVQALPFQPASQLPRGGRRG
jgi:hypothetical protein